MFMVILTMMINAEMDDGLNMQICVNSLQTNSNVHKVPLWIVSLHPPPPPNKNIL